MIELQHLSFHYKNQSNLFTDLNCTIPDGASLGLIGKNGSGKSTLIKIMLSILTPQQGTVLYDGQNIFRSRSKVVRRIGVVWGQRTSLWWDLSIRENIYRSAALFDISQEVVRTRLAAYTDFFPAAEIWDRPLRSVSFGQRVLSDILAVLIREPQVIILDEAFIGLDYSIKQRIIDALHTYKHQHPNCVYLMTSHNFEDISNLCTDIAYIRNESIDFYSLNTISSERHSKITMQVKDSFNTKVLSGYQTQITQDHIIVTVEGSLNQFFQHIDWDAIVDLSIEDITLTHLMNDVFGE